MSIELVGSGRHCSKRFLYFNSLNPHGGFSRYLQIRISVIDMRQTQAPKTEAICSRLQIWRNLEEPTWDPGCLAPALMLLTVGNPASQIQFAVCGEEWEESRTRGRKSAQEAVAQARARGNG